MYWSTVLYSTHNCLLSFQPRAFCGIWIDKEEENVLRRPRSIEWELIPFEALFSQNPIKLAYVPSLPAVLTASAFNHIGQYATANSPGKRPTALQNSLFLPWQ